MGDVDGSDEKSKMLIFFQYSQLYEIFLKVLKVLFFSNILKLSFTNSIFNRVLNICLTGVFVRKALSK